VALFSIASIVPALPRIKIVYVGAADGAELPAYARLTGGLPCDVVGFEPGAAECATTRFLLVIPVGGRVMSPLENRFPRPPLPGHVEGIFVLSGGESPDLFAFRGTAATIFSEGRLVEALDLARRFPQARIVFSGVEANVARAAFAQIGAPMNRFTFEDQARNTFENLLFSKNLVGPKPEET